MPLWMGIDIGRSAVKVAVVRSAYRKVSLEALVSVDIAATPTPMPTPRTSAGHISVAAIAADPAAPPPDGPAPIAPALLEAIRAAVSAAHGGRVVAGDGIAAAISGDRMVVRQLTLPASVQRQLAEVLPFELEAQLPFDMDGAVFDSRVLPQRTAEATINLVTAVSRVEDVRAVIEQVRAAISAEPDRIAAGGLALASLVGYIPQLAPPEETPVVVVDFGANGSDLVIFRGGEPVFTRTLPLGTSGLPAAAPELGRELRRSMNAFRASGGDAPTRAYLCGGGAFVSGAANFLGKELGLTVELLPPPAIELVKLGNERVAEMPRFAKAVALALSLGSRTPGLNLRQGPLAYERGYGWMKEKLPLLAGLASVILVSFFFASWTKLHALEKDREGLSSALAMVTREVFGEETTSAQRAGDLLAQTQVNDEDPMGHADAFDVLVRLSEMIPQSITHDIEELDVQKGHVVIHGIVGSIPEAQSIATSLRTERCFADVKITRTNQVVGGDRQKYVMELDLKCPEDVKTKKGQPGTASSGVATSSAGGK